MHDPELARVMSGTARSPAADHQPSFDIREAYMRKLGMSSDQAAVPATTVLGALQQATEHEANRSRSPTFSDDLGSDTPDGFEAQDQYDSYKYRPDTPVDDDGGGEFSPGACGTTLCILCMSTTRLSILLII